MALIALIAKKALETQALIKNWTGMRNLLRR